MIAAEHGPALRTSRAAVNLQFHLGLAEPVTFEKELREISEARAMNNVFLQRARRHTLTIVPALKLTRVPPPATHTDIDPETPAGRAILLADEVRRTPRAARSPLIRQYVQLRRGIQEHLPSYAEAHARTVAQADQSVSHDAMDASDAAGFEDVDALRKAAGPPGPLDAYRLLTWRDRGLLASKRGDLSVAVRTTDRGIHDLLALSGEQQGDRHALLESLHQHLLSNAGTSVKLVEGLLEDLPAHAAHRRSARFYEFWANTAVSYAAQTYEVLRDLDGPHQDGLPRLRHADGFIASQDWRIQTRIMHLRALLGAQTLLAATNSENPDEVASRDVMRLLYTEIASDPRLRVPRIYTFTQLAIWLALIDGLELPYVRAPSIGLSQVPFLALSEAEVPAEGAVVHIDEERIVRAKEWFASVDGWDRGPITRVRRGSAAWAKLAVMTDNMAERWLVDELH